MAQFYHVLSWRGLPLKLAATLAAGLPEESRCVRRVSGARCGADTLLLARIADAAALLVWRYTKKNTPKPRSLLELLAGEDAPKTEIRVFKDGKVFDAALARFIDAGGAYPKGTGAPPLRENREVSENAR